MRGRSLMQAVSVVMAVRNGEEYLREAIDSILGQTMTDFEFIVIDDGSTDRTTEILESYDDSRLRVLTQTGRGLAPSLNAGIRQARASLIARMDADDISEPSRLERQSAFLFANDDHVLIGYDALVISEDGERLHRAQMVTGNTEIENSLDKLVNPFFHGAVMFRRDAVIECGLYDELVAQHVAKTVGRAKAVLEFEDILLWLRLRRFGLMANLPESLYRYRLRANSVSRIPRAWRRTRTRVLRQYASTLTLTPDDVRDIVNLQNKTTERRRRAAYELDLGKIYLDQAGDLPCARRHLTRAVALAPVSPRAWFNLCLSLSPRAVRSWRIRQLNRRIHLRAGPYR